MLGVDLRALSIADLHREMAAAIAAGERRVIGHQNLHGLYQLPHEPAMREFARRADGVFLDGMPLVWMARRLGHRLDRRHRVTYADWVEPLMAECARRGWRVFHLGGRPGVGERAAARLVERHPGLEMATRPGFFEPAADPEVLAEIAAFAPDVLMVGMGMPRQEAWVVANLDKIESRVILTCGACMDYVAGAISTPPRWMGRAGLEWLYRLASEPRRLAKRYLLEPWPVLWRFLGEWRRRPR
jgi:N-acetylglucosaminyldiphosphoundecaprenol N-acetyl-beta-D-mannosaminyltransferase